MSGLHDHIADYVNSEYFAFLPDALKAPAEPVLAQFRDHLVAATLKQAANAVGHLNSQEFRDHLVTATLRLQR